MRKPIAIQKYFGPTDGRTDEPTDTARCRVACPRLKIGEKNLGAFIAVTICRVNQIISFLTFETVPNFRSGGCPSMA